MNCAVNPKPSAFKFKKSQGLSPPGFLNYEGIGFGIRVAPEPVYKILENKNITWNIGTPSL